MVRQTVFSRRHLVVGSDEAVFDCFVDSDAIIRKPVGFDTDEVVTHWASLPSLPGTGSSRRLVENHADQAIARVAGRKSFGTCEA